MIVGITGTNGAGKGTIVEYLVNTKGFNHFSVRSLLIEEITKRGLPVDRPHMRQVANELRQEHGPAYVVEQLVRKAKEVEGNSVVESIRTVGEAELLQSLGATLWAVDADRRARFERVLKRLSETDHVTFEQFCIYEDQELHSAEPWNMNVFAVMKMADHVFSNNGTQEELFLQVEDVLKKVQ